MDYAPGSLVLNFKDIYALSKRVDWKPFPNERRDMYDAKPANARPRGDLQLDDRCDSDVTSIYHSTSPSECVSWSWSASSSSCSCMSRETRRHCWCRSRRPLRRAANYRKALGLDRPVYEQYLQFMGNFWLSDTVKSFRFHQPLLPLSPAASEVHPDSGRPDDRDQQRPGRATGHHLGPEAWFGVGCRHPCRGGHGAIDAEFLGGDAANADSGGTPAALSRLRPGGEEHRPADHHPGVFSDGGLAASGALGDVGSDASGLYPHRAGQRPVRNSG